MATVVEAVDLHRTYKTTTGTFRRRSLEVEAVSDGVVVEVEVYGIETNAVDGLRTIDGVTSVAIEDQDQAQVVVVQAANGHEPTRSRGSSRPRGG